MATSLPFCVISATTAAAATMQSALPNVALFRLQKPSSIRCSAAHNFIRANYRNRQGLGKTLHYASVAGDDDGLGVELDLGVAGDVDLGMMSSEEEGPSLEEILIGIEEGDLMIGIGTDPGSEEETDPLDDLEIGVGTEGDAGTDNAETEIQPQTQDDE